MNQFVRDGISYIANHVPKVWYSMKVGAKRWGNISTIFVVVLQMATFSKKSYIPKYNFIH